MESSNDIHASDGPQNIMENENAPEELRQETGIGKVPRKVLHFSDGVLEEYSTDEEDENDKPEPSKAVDTKKLTWPQYFLYATMSFGNGTLKVCDYLGEGLANFFGITTPKYQYEINEYERMVKEQEEAKKKEDIEMRGWHESNKDENPPVVSAGPTSASVSEVRERY